MSVEVPVGVGIKAILAHPSVIGMVVAPIIVILMTMPRTRKQQVVALLCTVFASLFGGAALMDYFELTKHLGALAQGGVYFVAGLPAWVCVRGFYAYTESNKGKGILEYIKEVRAAWKAEEKK